MPRPWRLRLILLISIAAALGRLGFHDFTGWDDPGTIHHNPAFHPPTLRSVGQYWTAFGERAPFGLYIPLTYTVWGALAKVALLEPDELGIRLNPYVFHLANVVLHALAAMVVFELLRLLLNDEHGWAALVGATVWALHPVQVEPVAWASGTKDVLCGLLSFAALWQYLKFTRIDDQRRARAIIRYALATLAFVAAMLAKPTAVVVPLIALVLDVFVQRREVKRSMIALLPWFILTIPCIIWTRLAQTTPEVAHVPIYLRPLIAADALAFYLYKLLWPANLGFDYGRRPARAIESGWIWYTWVLPLSVAVALWLARRRAPLLVAGGLVFVIGLLPVLGLVPFQFQRYSTVADHYLYMSMLGVAMVVAWLVTWLASQVPRAAVLAGAFAIVAMLGVLSFRQGAHWRDDITLNCRALTVNPDSFVAHNNLGAHLMFRGQLEEAEWHLRRAIELLPAYGTAYDNLADALVRRGRRDEAVAAQIEVAQQLLDLGREAEAAQHFEAALKLDPENAEAQRGLERATRSAPSLSGRGPG